MSQADSAGQAVGTAADARAVAAVQDALRLACVSLPHLAGLAYVVRVSADPRAGTIGVFPSGRVVVNPAWFSQLNRREATYVVAHELLHLALHTHQRAIGSDRELFNQAHDYIINDILTNELGLDPPAEGLHLPGASERSAESLVDELARARRDRSSWSDHGGPDAETALGAALRKAAGLDAPPPPAHHGSDVLPSTLEDDWFPELDRAERRRAEQQVRESAARSVSLDLLRRRLEGDRGGPGGETGGAGLLTHALRTYYQPPWEAALQQWMEAIAPGPRSYARPSRRGADRTDVVLPGRKREGWTFHVVLDTSGSMEDELSRALGAIATFCEGVGVSDVHILQCDVEVTRDQFVAVEQLAAYEIDGLGGSDMSPAMARLAEDPEVEAAIVLTDGYIGYPDKPPPYAVLWVLTEAYYGFQPPYGNVVVMG